MNVIPGTLNLINLLSSTVHVQTFRGKENIGMGINPLLRKFWSRCKATR